ncbi:MAG: TIGR00153 family protein [Deltaproteobacteria bacterium]|nr:TIGR00153 family protein [Deltaproteobacteria bacterium]MBW2363183.1 TIGR00153 family protein [Deltaproteobacteria bacterium]
MAIMGNLFGRSPIRPMQQHMHAAVACARMVVPLFEAMSNGDRDALPGLRAEVDRLEHEADRLKHEIRSHLPRRLMLAVERRDLLEILDFQDSIADRAQDAAELADQRGMLVPESMKVGMRDLARRVVDACEQAGKIIDELDQLLETGFAGREVERVEAMITELSRIESDTDELAETLQRELFTLEDELGVGTVFWWELINVVASIADHAERVGNRLRLLIAS